MERERISRWRRARGSLVGICDDERAERVLFKQKSFDDKRIKLCPPAFHDDLPGGFVVEGGLYTRLEISAS